MQAEIEAKFIDVDIADIRERLERAGATLEQPMRDMRRVLIEEPHHAAERSFIRIRDEGDKVTLAFKRKNAKRGEDTVSSTHELETTVGDFDTTVKIFQEAGWGYVTYQESRRETWHLGDTEVVIDEWPWIKPYIEIEASSVEVVQDVAKTLGFDWNETVFGSVGVIYKRDYPNMTVSKDILNIKEVRFGDPVPLEFMGEQKQ